MNGGITEVRGIASAMRRHQCPKFLAMLDNVNFYRQKMGCYTEAVNSSVCGNYACLRSGNETLAQLPWYSMSFA